MAKVSKGVETLSKISTDWVGRTKYERYRRQTDWFTTYSEANVNAQSRVKYDAILFYFIFIEALSYIAYFTCAATFIEHVNSVTDILYCSDITVVYR